MATDLHQPPAITMLYDDLGNGSARFGTDEVVDMDTKN
jgi:hypothetical protein